MYLAYAIAVEAIQTARRSEKRERESVYAAETSEG